MNQYEKIKNWSLPEKKPETADIREKSEKVLFEFNWPLLDRLWSRLETVFLCGSVISVVAGVSLTAVSYGGTTRFLYPEISNVANVMIIPFAAFGLAYLGSKWAHRKFTETFLEDIAKL